MNIVVGEKACVATAVSTIRNLLGYKTAYPNNVQFPTGGMDTLDVAKNAQAFFPEHDVAVWCSQQNGKDLGDVYKGNCFSNSDFDSKHVVMFDYYDKGNLDKSHMVIGCPHTYGNMGISIVVRISLNRKRNNAISISDFLKRKSRNVLG